MIILRNSGILENTLCTGQLYTVFGKKYVTTQRTQKLKDYHHEEHEAHEAQEGRFKPFINEKMLI